MVELAATLFVLWVIVKLFIAFCETAGSGGSVDSGPVESERDKMRRIYKRALQAERAALAAEKGKG